MRSTPWSPGISTEPAPPRRPPAPRRSGATACRLSTACRSGSRTWNRPRAFAPPSAARCFAATFHWLAMAYAVTVVGHPALSLPAGLDRNGMPFGLQIVGPRGGDSLVLRVAAELETLLAADPRTARSVPDLAALKTARPISRAEGFLGFGCGNLIQINAGTVPVPRMPPSIHATERDYDNGERSISHDGHRGICFVLGGAGLSILAAVPLGTATGAGASTGTGGGPCKGTARLHPGVTGKRRPPTYTNPPKD
jgi:hypothetical protein